MWIFFLWSVSITRNYTVTLHCTSCSCLLPSEPPHESLYDLQYNTIHNLSLSTPSTVHPSIQTYLQPTIIYCTSYNNTLPTTLHFQLYDLQYSSTHNLTHSIVQPTIKHYPHPYIIYCTIYNTSLPTTLHYLPHDLPISASWLMWSSCAAFLEFTFLKAFFILCSEMINILLSELSISRTISVISCSLKVSIKDINPLKMCLHLLFRSLLFYSSLCSLPLPQIPRATLSEL